ncbi:hypothetical protein EYF80_016798 [Liparis tanakae]|uniref:Uncharacterized protein n=1 Tax=Liparis tanakae TaxID=230148 RepID=A0A4Z2I4W5_9TELE|nr:hypothetical protein EYF80_016798 [Liparis tanakae]
MLFNDKEVMKTMAVLKIGTIARRQGQMGRCRWSTPAAPGSVSSAGVSRSQMEESSLGSESALSYISLSPWTDFVMDAALTAVNGGPRAEAEEEEEEEEEQQQFIDEDGSDEKEEEEEEEEEETGGAVSEEKQKGVGDVGLTGSEADMEEDKESLKVPRLKRKSREDSESSQAKRITTGRRKARRRGAESKSSMEENRSAKIINNIIDCEIQPHSYSGSLLWLLEEPPEHGARKSLQTGPQTLADDLEDEKAAAGDGGKPHLRCSHPSESAMEGAKPADSSERSKVVAGGPSSCRPASTNTKRREVCCSMAQLHQRLANTDTNQAAGHSWTGLDFFIFSTSSLVDEMGAELLGY